MKILSIRFANLNSLAGEWCIDFTTAEYVSSGIFAIVGTTGSGKSTILDAISLALYGRTPRLKQITKTSNEIMTRHTGYCYAEVDFSSVRGRYRSHWSQHRARKSPSGELQQPRHEIVDAETDRVLASKIKDVGSCVTKVTGMDFDQFTRSMLLAQGDFSKFLQAGSDDRAPILEQITGTEIYSQISQQVHLQKTAEENKLKTLEQEIAGFNLMTESEENECRKTLQHLFIQATSLQKMLATGNESINWQKMVQHLSSSVARQRMASERAEEKWQEAAPQRERLRRGMAAQLFADPYNQLEQLRSLQQEEHTNAEKTAKERNIAMQLLQEAGERMAGCKEQFARVTEKKMRTDNIINEVIQLDLLSSQQQEILAELQQAIEDDDEKLATLHKEGARLAASLDDSRRKQHELDEYFTAHVHDADLVENFAGIKEQIGVYSRLLAKTERLTKEHQQMTAARIAINTVALRGKKAVEKAASLVARHQKTIEDLNHELAKWTDQDIARLYGLSHQQAGRAAALNLAIKSVAQLGGCRKITTQLEHEIDETVKRIEEIRRKGDVENERFRLLHDNVIKQEEIVIFATKVEAYEQERMKLEDGTPCPLCGSKVHPFSDNTGDNIPDQARQQLRADRKRLEECDEQRKKLQTNLGILDHTLRLNQQNRQTNEEQHLQLTKELKTLCRQLQLEDEPSLSQLHEMAATTDLDYQESQKIISNAERITLAIKNSEQNLEQASQAYTREERELQQAQFDLQKTQEQIKELERQRTSMLEEQDITRQQVSKQIASYNIGQLTESNLNEVIGQLSDKKDQWKKGVAARQELDTARQTLLAELSRTQLSISHVTAEKSKKYAKLQPLKRELDTLKEKRLTLFGEKDPIETGRQLQAEVELAERNIQDCSAIITRHEKIVSTLTERASNLAIAATSRTKRIELEENNLAAKLREAGFESTSDFQAALMPNDELHRSQSFLDDLREQKTETRALLKSTESSLQTEQAKQLTTHSLETLVKEQAEQNRQLSEIQQKLGAEKNRLDRQEQVKREQGSLKEQLRLQHVEFSHWAKLHDLIGSADGKKFRNFAQGLTFELMVVHANRTLAMMSERYLLIRHPDHPLELNVIDNYQAGEIRSTANLSGGESFIISLALALGLASMAGKNIQVNSLFLDEGFGTLDEESLEVALETLSCLQQEGKIIGIISHVPLLKERISVQLQLTASPTGRSRIQGPGVSHCR